MKKYTFNYDPKIKNYIITYIAAAGLAYIVSTFQLYTAKQYSLDLLDTMKAFLIVFFILGLFLLYNLLAAVTSKNTISDIYLKYGTFGLRKIYYYSISSIEFNGDIVLKCDTKKVKLKVFNLDENKEKYAEILKAINDNSKLEFSVDEALETLDYYHNYKFLKKGETLRLNSWIFLIYVNFIIITVFLGLYELISLVSILATQNLILILISLLILAALIIMIIVLVKISEKRKKAVKYLKRIFILGLVLLCVSYLVTTFTSLISSISFNILASVLSAAGQLFFILTIIRYLNISKRVANTFVYDKGQPAIYADREHDPGFRLFKNDPASIYGILTWIVVPVIVVVMMIVFYSNILTMYM